MTMEPCYYLVILEIERAQEYRCDDSDEEDDDKESEMTLGDIEKIKNDSLAKFNSSGIEEFSMDEAEVDEMLGDRSYSGGDIPIETLLEVESKNALKKNISFKFYFDSERAEFDSENFVEYINIIKAKYPSIIVKKEKKQYEDWDKIWKEFYSPIKISSIFEIIPSFLKDNYQSDSQCFVYIYPGQGFGTGGHETTHLCLEFLSELCSDDKNKRGPFSFDNAKILDFGCGSGILGISALKYCYKNNLNFSVVDLLDIDSKALENAQINLEWNFDKSAFPKNVNLIQKNTARGLNLQGSKEGHNLIFANILMNVLLEEKSYLISLLAPNGFLIISGLLQEQMNITLNEYLRNNENNDLKLKLISQKTKGDWGALLLQKIDK
ncbi:MAG: 50S ribosomal protein L11 methyltransferase [Oligoflexia bacterium]|nr:50S ribosomal protein L11 methyltransferase [Oligoflexia bacterium]